MALTRDIASLSGPGHSALGWSSLLSCPEAQNALLSLLTKGSSPLSHRRLLIEIPEHSVCSTGEGEGAVG